MILGYTPEEHQYIHTQNESFCLFVSDIKGGKGGRVRGNNLKEKVKKGQY